LLLLFRLLPTVRRSLFFSGGLYKANRGGRGLLSVGDLPLETGKSYNLGLSHLSPNQGVTYKWRNDFL